MFAVLHLAITFFNFEFPAGSGPPSLTAIKKFSSNFVNIFPLAASAFPFCVEYYAILNVLTYFSPPL